MWVQCDVHGDLRKLIMNQSFISPNVEIGVKECTGSISVSVNIILRFYLHNVTYKVV